MEHVAAVVNVVAALAAAVLWLWTEVRLPLRTPPFAVLCLFVTTVTLAWYALLWLGIVSDSWLWTSDDVRLLLRWSFAPAILAPAVRSVLIVRRFRAIVEESDG